MVALLLFSWDVLCRVHIENSLHSIYKVTCSRAGLMMGYIKIKLRKNKKTKKKTKPGEIPSFKMLSHQQIFEDKF